MKKIPIIGLFLFSPILLNSGVTEESQKLYNKTNIELIEEQFYKLQEIANKQLETDLFLIKYKMYNKFSFENKLKVTKICEDLGINELHLYKVISIESKGNTKAVNKQSKATGIIQWLPSTARRLGTSIDSLYTMSMNEQLDYLYEYYKPICKKYKLNSYKDVYLAVFHPKALGKPNNYVIGNKDSKAVKQNKSIDVNNDGIIEVSEIIHLLAKN